MPDIAALSLQTTIAPVAAVPLENAGNPAETGTPPARGGFDALLALEGLMQGAKDAAASAPLPESGKALPDTAGPAIAAPLAASLAAAQTPVRTPLLPAMPGDDAAPDEAAGKSAPEAAVADTVPQPDIGLFAAIFAAPDRLTPDRLATGWQAPDQQAPATPHAQTAAAARALAVPIGVPAQLATPATLAAAIASSAQIELVPAARTPAPPPLQPPAVPALAPRLAAIQVAAPEFVAAPAGPAGALPAARPGNGPAAIAAASSGIAAFPDAPMVPKALPVVAVEAQLRSNAASVANPQVADAASSAPLIAPATPTGDATPVAAPASGEARPERIAFATLVDTLNRAREEAAPRTVNVAVTNTDFGRVSLRFDTSDAGLSVAMSSADPAFVRAASAAGEAQGASGDTRGQNGPAQSEARAQPGEGGAQRNNSQQNPQQQQAGTARHDPRSPARTTPDTRREDDAAATNGSNGIYA